MKTADELGIYNFTYDYLLRVRKTMDNPEFKNSFSMKDYTNKCGTVCCIVGHMALLYINDKNIEYNPFNFRITIDNFINNNIYNLFHPNMPSSKWGYIKLDDAKKAIDNFLEKGDPDWRSIRPNLFKITW